jgi:hypothetical protein
LAEQLIDSLMVIEIKRLIAAFYISGDALATGFECKRGRMSEGGEGSTTL